MVRQLFFQCFRRFENVFDSDAQYRVRDFKNIYSRVVHELVIPQGAAYWTECFRMVMDLLIVDTAFVLYSPENGSINGQQQVNPCSSLPITHLNFMSSICKVSVGAHLRREYCPRKKLELDGVHPISRIWHQKNMQEHLNGQTPREWLQLLWRDIVAERTMCMSTNRRNVFPCLCAAECSFFL